MKKNNKPTIRRFLHARHDPELQAITERLESLFRQNGLRQRILDFYEAFEGIDRYWGRETDLWAPLLAIAQAIDHEKPELGIHEKLMRIARSDLKKRREDSLFRWDTKWQLAVHDYMQDNNLTEEDFIVAEDLSNYAVEKIKPKYKFRTESLGRILESQHLLLERRIRWIKTEGGNEVQRTCYRIDRDKLSKIIKKFNRFIEPKESPKIPSLDELGRSLFSNLDIEGEK
jgi:hypothetical protein